MNYNREYTFRTRITVKYMDKLIAELEKNFFICDINIIEPLPDDVPAFRTITIKWNCLLDRNDYTKLSSIINTWWKKYKDED